MIFVRSAGELREALERARPGQTVRLAPGEYRLKAVVSTPGLTLLGAGADRTSIVWDDYAQKRDGRGGPFGTFRSWTLAVRAGGVAMRELSVVNDALRPEEKGQEVALAVCAGGFSMENCRLSSTQDTLFLGPLPRDLIARYSGFLPPWFLREGPWDQRFSGCLIEGTVDFIFGRGEALFERCELRSLPDARGAGYAAAPAHSPDQEAGFRFRDCRFTAGPGAAPGSVYLARPWRDYGLCVFQNCAYGPHIAPLGFDKWGGTGRDRTARFYELPPADGRAAWVNRGEPPF